MSQTFRIVLRDAEGFEGIECRKFDLSVGSTFPIGRASRNATKKELMPSENNAYIDSPVISRDHAVLSASAENGVAKVLLADCGSMHGTMVNGQRLTPKVPQQLSSGDSIQFGIDVNRNEEFYVARKYTFESELMPPQPPFSLGFTVPEAESEEEDITGTFPHRGSQNNPLTIDDSDHESDASDDEQPETTMVGDGFIVDEDDESAAADELESQVAHVESSEDEESLGDYPSDIDLRLDADMDSEASNMGDSVVDYNSEMDISDGEAEDDADAVGQQATSGSELPLHQVPVAPGLPAWAVRDSCSIQSYVSSLPPMMLHRSDMSSFPPPPLPPRPSGSQSSFFDLGDHSYPQKPHWLSESEAKVVHTFPGFLGTNHGDRPSLFSPAPAKNKPATQEAESTASLFEGTSTNFAPLNNNRLQTPPVMPQSDVTTSTPPLHGRRTKVSIDEIVEEQPPTPTSVNEMKRKADVLEEDELTTPQKQVATPPEEVVPAFDVPVVEAATDASRAEVVVVQTAATIAQRPKKQPRSIMSKLRNTAAFLGVSAIGAAGAVAMLTVLPDGFFA